jgi:hypothetical protein
MQIGIRWTFRQVMIATALPSALAATQLPEAQVAELWNELPRAEDSLVFLQNPVGATRFDDGTIVVADGMAQTVWTFDADGAFLRALGRPGEGPNEFSTPSWLGRCGPESALVWDFNLMRFTEVHPSRGIVDQRRLQDRTDLPRPPARLACSRHGYILAHLRLTGERIEGRVTSILTAPLYLVGPSGDARLIDERAPIIHWVNEDRTYLPVSPTTHFAVADSLVFLARSDSATVHLLDLDGAASGVWALDVSRRPPRDAHIRADAETLTEFVSDPVGRAEIIERYLRGERPDHLPGFSGLRVDPGGRLWIVASVPGDAQTVLHCYGTRGRFQGAVTVPAELEVYEVGTDYVLGSRIDPRTLEPKILLYGFRGSC